MSQINSNGCPFEITPYAQAGVVKNPNIVSLNYTNQDFYSMKTRLVDFINERFGPNGTVLPNTFNDLVESDLAIMLIENWAFLADTLSFKMDQIVNEMFIDTVTEVENAFRLAKLVGFQPTPPIAASSMWSATLQSPLTTDVTLTTPLAVSFVSNNTSTQIELFQADSNNNPLFNQDIVIPAGSTINKSIIGLQGTTFNEQISGTGQIAQQYQLSQSPVIYGSVMVYVDGVPWTQVQYFTDSQPRREFRVEFDSSYNAYLIFGNNRAGMIPSQGSAINATYRVGGGTIGNIVTGYIQTQITTTVPGLNFSAPVTLQNYTAGQYGYDGDGIDQIRANLPLWISTQNRAVTGNDYKILAEQFVTPYFGQIGKATAALRNHGCSGNIIDLYILAKNGADNLQIASSDLKVALIQQLNQQKMLTDFVCVKDGSILLVDVSIDITLSAFYKNFELQNQQTIQQLVTSFFSLSNWDFGQTLKDTDLIKQLSSLNESQSFDVTFTTTDPNNSGAVVTSLYSQIIRPDTTNIAFVYV